MSVTVEIFDPANPWEVSETYQEILQLGGVAEDLPEWFQVPQDRLAYDFDEGTWFPSGWQLPRGKFACWEGAAKYNQTDRNGRHPMLDFGFTQVAENTLSIGGHVPDWEHQCRVFGDAEWLDMSDGGNFTKWHNDGWKERGQRMKIVIPDFENGDQWNWSPQHYDAFRNMVVDFKKAQAQLPVRLLGRRRHERLAADLRPASTIKADPPASCNLAAAKQWRDKYEQPEKELNPIFDRCGLTFGNPAVYWMKGGHRPICTRSFRSGRSANSLGPPCRMSCPPGFRRSSSTGIRCRPTASRSPMERYQVPRHQASGSAFVRLRHVAVRPLPHGWGVLLGDRIHVFGGRRRRRRGRRRRYADSGPEDDCRRLVEGRVLLHQVLRLLQLSCSGNVAGQPEQRYHRGRYRMVHAGVPHHRPVRSGEPGTSAIPATAISTKNHSYGRSRVPTGPSGW